MSRYDWIKSAEIVRVPYGSKVQSPFFAATDASKPCEQQPTLRRRKEAKDVDPTDSANAGA